MNRIPIWGLLAALFAVCIVQTATNVQAQEPAKDKLVEKLETAEKALETATGNKKKADAGVIEAQKALKAALEKAGLEKKGEDGAKLLVTAAKKEIVSDATAKLIDHRKKLAGMKDAKRPETELKLVTRLIDQSEKTIKSHGGIIPLEAPKLAPKLAPKIEKKLPLVTPKIEKKDSPAPKFTPKAPEAGGTLFAANGNPYRTQVSWCENGRCMVGYTDLTADSTGYDGKRCILHGKYYPAARYLSQNGMLFRWWGGDSAGSYTPGWYHFTGSPLSEDSAGAVDVTPRPTTTVYYGNSSCNSGGFSSSCNSGGFTAGNSCGGGGNGRFPVLRAIFGRR